MKIAVYGASGYTGRLIAAEALRQGHDVVLSGRSAARLQKAAALAPSAVEVRVAAAADPAALEAAFAGSDVVINSAGPFTQLAPPIVRAAIAAGSHYLDTAAEQHHLLGVFDAFADEARDAGVAVVPATAYDILPGDLIAHLTASRVEPVEDLIIGYDIQEFGMTRGTVRSAVSMLADGDVSYEDGAWGDGIPATRSTFAFPDRDAPVPVMKWPGCEIVSVPRHVRTRRVEIVIDAAAMTPEFAELLSQPPDVLAQVVDTLPEGPNEEARRATRFTIVVEATGADGQTAHGVLRGSDIYGLSAVIAVEGARRLVSDPPAGGVLTPAQAFDPIAFLDALAPHGVQWTVETSAPLATEAGAGS